MVLLGGAHLRLCSTILASGSSRLPKGSNKGQPIRIVHLLLVLIILGLAATAWDLVQMDRIDALANQVRGTLPCLTNVSFLLVLALAHLGSLHVRAVAQLALFVLVVCIVGRIRTRREMIIVA